MNRFGGRPVAAGAAWLVIAVCILPALHLAHHHDAATCDYCVSWSQGVAVGQPPVLPFPGGPTEPGPTASAGEPAVAAGSVARSRAPPTPLS